LLNMKQVPQKATSWSVTVHNKYLSSQCNFTAQIHLEPVQDESTFVFMFSPTLG
jgi:hypothetical protein